MGTLAFTPGQSHTISNDLLTSTLYEIAAEAKDQLFQKTAFLDHASKFGGVVRKTGAEVWTEPLSVVEHSNITQLTTGFEPINLNVSDVLQPASYRWCKFAAPIAISRDEELSNSGEAAVVDILQSRMDSVMGLLRREIETQIVANNSTVLSDLNTLYGGYTSNAVNDGFIYLEDTDTNGGTVGGIARSTATGLINQAVDDVSSTNLVDTITQAWIKADHYAYKGSTNLLIAGEAAFKAYKSELYSHERYVDATKLDGGRLVLAFQGVPFEFSNWMTSSVATGSSSTLDKAIYGINFDGIKLRIDPQADFHVTPFRDMDAQLARVAFVHLRMQLYACHLASQFCVFNVGA